ncbi:MAG TPA: NUDIX domain-containing protein [Candidatus Paceibacterota bacterium]|nr:NUDIX domain-containing protein [Candidatus Paceibacterota bacterium]
MELIDVLDEKGEKTGEIRSKPEIHRVGLWHGVTHIWFVNNQGNLILQKRSAQKESYPALFDISVAGHIDSGEDSLKASLREIEEETGHKAEESKLVFLTRIRSSVTEKDGTYLNNEFQDVYIYKTDVDYGTFTFNPIEVESFTSIPWRELKKKLEDEPNNFVPHPEEYKILFEYLEKEGF